MVCHRRAGKTVSCVYELITRALYTTKKRAKYAYVGPFRQQAKEIAWEYLKEGTEGIRKGPPRESDLRITLPNGATITLYGADNPDALRGLYFDGVVIDEYGDCRPTLWGEVILPTLMDRRGWAVFIGTIRGKNHFYRILERAKAEPTWHYMQLKASESGILSDEDLKEARGIMTESQYQQEMECNPDAAVQGTYYANIIAAKEGDKSIGDHPYDPDEMVHVSADLGFTDSTSFWFWQMTRKGPNLIDYEEHDGQSLEFYFELLKGKDYEYADFWLPHDAKAKTLQTGRSTIEQFLDQGFPAKVVPKLAVQHGIDAGRLMLKQCTINKETCYTGIEALRGYRRQYNEKTNQYANTPLHDWCCLPAGTMINTPNGQKAVEEFVAGDEVVTAGKVGKVTRAQLVKKSRIVQIVTSTGGAINCTPEHKIFTRLGLVMAKDLRYNDVLLREEDVDQWLESEKGIRRAFTESTLASDIITGPSELFTSVRLVASKLCSTVFGGVMRWEKFQSPMLLSRPMEIGTNSVLRSGSAGHTPRMGLSSKSSVLSGGIAGLVITSREMDSLPTIITPIKTAGKQRCTGIYTKTTMGISPKDIISTISTLTQKIMNLKIFRRSLRVITVCYTPEQESVFDIEVETDHAYTLSESGVVTSNSNGADAFRYFALVTDTDKPVEAEANTATPLLKAPEYTLDELFADREDDSWRRKVIRI